MWRMKTWPWWFFVITKTLGENGYNGDTGTRGDGGLGGVGGILSGDAEKRKSDDGRNGEPGGAGGTGGTGGNGIWILDSMTLTNNAIIQLGGNYSLPGDNGDSGGAGGIGGNAYSNPVREGADGRNKGVKAWIVNYD